MLATGQHCARQAPEITSVRSTPLPIPIGRQAAAPAAPADLWQELHTTATACCTPRRAWQGSRKERNNLGYLVLRQEL